MKHFANVLLIMFFLYYGFILIGEFLIYSEQNKRCEKYLTNELDRLECIERMYEEKESSYSVLNDMLGRSSSN